MVKLCKQLIPKTDILVTSKVVLLIPGYQGVIIIIYSQ